MLSNWQIALHFDLDDLFISPFDRQNLGPASLDLTRGRFRRMVKGRPLYEESAEMVIEPGESVIVYSRETIGLPNFLAGRAGGISWLIENGLQVCFGLQLDPGWKGNPYALIHNVGFEGYEIPTGDAFLSVEFSYLSTPPDFDLE